jgi:hypothetical protein
MNGQARGSATHYERFTEDDDHRFGRVRMSSFKWLGNNRLEVKKNTFDEQSCLFLFFLSLCCMFLH